VAGEMADKQFESLRKRLYEQYRWGIKPAAISLDIFGVLVLVAWYLTNARRHEISHT
jgi:hypothetical protein